MLRDASLPFMFLQLELLCQFNPKERRHPVLIASAAPQQYVGIEAVVLAILRFAIREAGKPAETSPVSRAGVTLISASKCLSDECREICWVNIVMLEPRLKISCTGLNDRTWLEIVRCEPVNRALIQVV